ncbi:MAG: Abi family protein [Bacteroidia bacterium]
MIYQDFENLFSLSRTKKYLIATSSKRVSAKRLYAQNLILSQSFHPLLITVEICLRNSISKALAIHFSDPDWILNQQTGFMVDPSLRGNQYIKREIDKAKNKILRKGYVITSDRLIAEQTFGFWIAFLDTDYSRLIGGCAMHAFPNRPSSLQRKQLYSIIKEVGDFRNRINHGEPICFTGNKIDTSKANNIFNHLKNISFWINPVLQPYLLRLENGMVARQIATINAI